MRNGVQHAQSRLAAIVALLQRDPVCLSIVAYLDRHRQAVDTAQGIADWWIARDAAATEAALLTLLRLDVVRSSVVQGNTCVYGYTRNPLLRQALSRHLRGLGTPARA